MMPNGTAQTAMSRIAPLCAPRARSRYSVSTAAAMMPRMMQRAYARIGTGPICHTAWVGLGIAARVTGEHGTVAHGADGTPGSSRIYPDTARNAHSARTTADV